MKRALVASSDTDTRMDNRRDRSRGVALLATAAALLALTLPASAIQIPAGDSYATNHGIDDDRWHLIEQRRLAPPARIEGMRQVIGR